MRKQECGKSKGEFWPTQKGNVVVKGKVILCMLSLIKYVAQRKCGLSYTRPHVSSSTNQAADQHIQARIFRLKCLLPSLFTSPWTVIPSC